MAVGVHGAAGPLLEKVYDEDCPGCRVERRKELHRGMPYKEFVYVWLVTLCTALPVASLFPFLYFMIRDLHIAKREEDIGYYAGYVGSSFMIGRALTSFFWGVMADRYGRKPVIMFSVISVIIFNTLFGLSTSFWMAVLTRFLLGLLNGLLVPIKAYASEICRGEHQAFGLSLIITARGTGLIIGPAIGGFFSQPAEKFPNIFSKESIFGRFPYFLPCLCISIFAIGIFVACFWLPETLHTHNKKIKEDTSSESLEAPEVDPVLEKMDEQNGGSESTPKENLLKNWPFMSAIIVYCIISLHDVAYAEIFSLWAESDRRFGGLSFATQDVGEILTITGFSLLAFQLVIYPQVERILGPMVSAQIAGVLTVPLLLGYPFFVKLSGVQLFVVLNCASLLKNILAIIVMTGLFVLQNNAVEQHQRGAANGIAVTAMSIFKALAPGAAGSLFAWSQERQSASFLPGDQMVFFVLSVVELIGILLTLPPFAPKTQKQDS